MVKPLVDNRKYTILISNLAAALALCLSGLFFPGSSHCGLLTISGLAGTSEETHPCFPSAYYSVSPDWPVVAGTRQWNQLL